MESLRSVLREPASLGDSIVALVVWLVSGGAATYYFAVAMGFSASALVPAAIFVLGAVVLARPVRAAIRRRRHRRTL